MDVGQWETDGAEASTHLLAPGWAGGKHSPCLACACSLPLLAAPLSGQQVMGCIPHHHHCPLQ